MRERERGERRERDQDVSLECPVPQVLEERLEVCLGLREEGARREPLGKQVTSSLEG